MNAKRLVLGSLLAALPLGSGCLSNNYRAFHEAMHVTDRSPFTNQIRSQVYLFMMNGSDHLELAGMLTLRDELAKCGFCKVYYSQKEDKNWFVKEIARLHRDEPHARILLLGYGTAAEKTLAVATEVSRLQVPLDGVVFLDPLNLEANVVDCLGTTSTVVTSHNWPGGKSLHVNQRVELSGVGHLSAPTEPTMVKFLVEMMTASASRVPEEDIRLTLPHLPLRDKPDRTPRPVTQ
jgi:hypothetical protein